MEVVDGSERRRTGQQCQGTQATNLITVSKLPRTLLIKKHNPAHLATAPALVVPTVSYISPWPMTSSRCFREASSRRKTLRFAAGQQGRLLVALWTVQPLEKVVDSYMLRTHGL